jgi:hypothetical protein
MCRNINVEINACLDDYGIIMNSTRHSHPNYQMYPLPTNGMETQQKKTNALPKSPWPLEKPIKVTHARDETSQTG